MLVLRMYNLFAICKWRNHTTDRSKIQNYRRCLKYVDYLSRRKHYTICRKPYSDNGLS